MMWLEQLRSAMSLAVYFRIFVVLDVLQFLQRKWNKKERYGIVY